MNSQTKALFLREFHGDLFAAARYCRRIAAMQGANAAEYAECADALQRYADAEVKAGTEFLLRADRLERGIDGY